MLTRVRYSLKEKQNQNNRVKDFLCILRRLLFVDDTTTRQTSE
jgi:hypothetical protein